MSPAWAQPVITVGPAPLTFIQSAWSSRIWSSVSSPSMTLIILSFSESGSGCSKAVALFIWPVVQMPGATSVGVFLSWIFPPAFSMWSIPSFLGTPMFRRFPFLSWWNLGRKVCGCA